MINIFEADTIFKETIGKYDSLIHSKTGGDNVPYFTAKEVCSIILAMGSNFATPVWLIWQSPSDLLGNGMVVPSIGLLDDVLATADYEVIEHRGTSEFISVSAARVINVIYDLYFYDDLDSAEEAYGPSEWVDDNDGLSRTTWWAKAYKLIKEKPELFEKRFPEFR